LNLSPELFISFENVDDSKIITEYNRPKWYTQDNHNVIQIVDEQLNIKGFLWIRNDVKGILPTIITKYLNLKNQQSEYASKGDPRYSASKTATYKLLINSMYGITGQIGSWIYVKYISAATTYHVREAIKSTIEYTNNVLCNGGDSVVFANTDSVFFSINTLWEEYKENNKPNMKILNKIINHFSGSLIPDMKFAFEGGYDFIYIPANKNKYITFKYNINDNKEIPQLNDVLFNRILNNPHSFMNEIKALGDLSYKSF